jgi:hypothetical protein
MGHRLLYAPGFQGMGVLWILGLLCVIALFAYLLWRPADRVALRGLSSGQAVILADFETRVLAMLSQRGEGMTQIDICRDLGLPSEVTAPKLLAMEKAHLISRTWVNEAYTYVVKAETQG